MYSVRVQCMCCNYRPSYSAPCTYVAKQRNLSRAWVTMLDTSQMLIYTHAVFFAAFTFNFYSLQISFVDCGTTV